jgi:hypothetical protein
VVLCCVESLAVINAQVYRHYLWTSIMTHPLGLFWMMILFFQHLEPTFVLVQARGQGYGWLLGHLFVRFVLHNLLSFQRCVFLLV